MDEPTANLDYGNQSVVLDEIARLKSAGVAVFFSTHNPEHALRIADRALMIRAGAIMAAGATGDVVNSENLSALYGRRIEVAEVASADGTRRRVCIPRDPARVTYPGIAGRIGWLGNHDTPRSRTASHRAPRRAACSPCARATAPVLGLSAAEFAILKRLSTPERIQAWLNATPINHEIGGETVLSVREVIRQRRAHCIEGAMFAACALWVHGIRRWSCTSTATSPTIPT
jgi:ABC-type glutathione transport system ATPase component